MRRTGTTKRGKSKTKAKTGTNNPTGLQLVPLTEQSQRDRGLWNPLDNVAWDMYRNAERHACVAHGHEPRGGTTTAPAFDILMHVQTGGPVKGGGHV